MLANAALVHGEPESDFSAKAAESPPEIKSGGGGGEVNNRLQSSQSLCSSQEPLFQVY